MVLASDQEWGELKRCGNADGLSHDAAKCVLLPIDGVFFVKRYFAIFAIRSPTDLNPTDAVGNAWGLLICCFCRVIEKNVVDMVKHRGAGQTWGWMYSK